MRAHTGSVSCLGVGPALAVSEVLSWDAALAATALHCDTGHVSTLLSPNFCDKTQLWLMAGAQTDRKEA